MIQMEVWTTIRCLKAKGKSIRWIARELGVSRNTVRKALRGEKTPEYIRQFSINPALLPYIEEIKKMYLVHKFIGTRILKEIRKMGYSGSRSGFYRYFKKLRRINNLSKVSERFETEPGRQAQFDWSPYTVIIGSKLMKVMVFRLILGYSRLQCLDVSLDETQCSIFEAIEDGFWRAGGIPKEILIDNAKAMVQNPNPRNFEWNSKFLEFCGYYRIKPVACKVRKARTKGKVENPFYYLEQHFIKGNEWKDFNDFKERLLSFEEEVNNKIHETTQEKPIERYEEERGALTPLPEHKFVGVHEMFRKVSWDCLISYRNSRYSVPHQFVSRSVWTGKGVWVKPSQGVKLKIFSQKGELLAEHNLSTKKKEIVINPKHYEGLRKKVPDTLDYLKKIFLEKFPEEELFLEKLISQQKLNVRYHLKAIIGLSNYYSSEAMCKAFSYAREYNTFSHNFIRGVLEMDGEIAMEEVSSPHTLVRFPRVNIKRDLRYYRMGG